MADALAWRDGIVCVCVWENGRVGLAYRYQDLDVVDGGGCGWVKQAY